MLINDHKWFDKDYLTNLSREDAISVIEEAVYLVSHLFERLEGVGKLQHNGHHMMSVTTLET